LPSCAGSCKPDSRCSAPACAHDAEATITQAVKAGAKLVRPAQDQFYGERSGTVRDPFGYDWMLGHSIEEVEPAEMQRRYDELMKKSAS
jgi:PhnB protein